MSVTPAPRSGSVQLVLLVLRLVLGILFLSVWASKIAGRACPSARADALILAVVARHA